MRRRTARGFTIVETLVAITVLMISVAGPLVVASKGLTAALYARDQMTASFLAQETMEVVKNAHDNNMADTSASTWLSYYQLDSNQCTRANPCDASAIGASGNTWNITSGASAPLALDDQNGYGITGSSDSIFSRSFYLSDPASPDPNNPAPCTASLTECSVIVTVSWNEGTIPYEVRLSSEIDKVLR